ncbi:MULTISPECIES: DUF2780 domain-containing protein [Shewanella]|uniref:DUF2780 domain-containing protein n=1 Tax=Shewanella psychromarinicola TaxID=2487742 RepID=A0A3N4E1S5_9GAMM|nr:DUF2780 domain-containing protein [Shewanella psychromarinicola]AZG34016.1 DUF2780 domain-containing protein [Shewanella psychromarinicola]MCL1081325.1 DUF2780 domain-containing protein [Shewanella psychromarinicola]RPA32109.1 DUF2780 domain-containing protein [Shewanella psychromarinicola]
MKLALSLAILFSAFIFSAPASAGWLDNVTEITKKPAAEQAKTIDQSQATEQSSVLVASVMSQLGLTQPQAEGGLGSLLSLAQSNLGANDFSQLSDSIPNTDGLLAAVPALASDSGMSGLLSKTGDLGTALQGSAMVYDAFDKLGISKEYITPMVNIAKNYLQQSGGDGTVDLLIKGLGSVL